jgi:hypothetical protein
MHHQHVDIAELVNGAAQLGAVGLRAARRFRQDLLARSITSKGASFRSLNDTWADTTTAHGRLMLTVLEAGLRGGSVIRAIRAKGGHDQPAQAHKFTGDAKIHVDFRGMPRGVKPKPACPGCLARSAWHGAAPCRLQIRIVERQISEE